MDDLVSRKGLERQARIRLSYAITESVSGQKDSVMWAREADVWRAVIGILRAEPSALAATKEGKWMTGRWRGASVRCSLCGNRAGVKTAFCSGCGAKMLNVSRESEERYAEKG